MKSGENAELSKREIYALARSCNESNNRGTRVEPAVKENRHNDDLSPEVRDVNLLRLLIQAHRDRNDELFDQAAQSLVAKELAANHHAEAQELMRALKPRRRVDSRKLNTLSSRDDLAEVITYVHFESLPVEPVFSTAIRKSLDRFILERREASRLAEYGLKPDSKLLFWGPPGCGKSLTAAYLSIELGLQFGLLNLSTVVSSLLGGTANQLSRIFQIVESKPMILLLDEFDTIAKERNDAFDVGESKRIVNSVLQLIEHFSSPTSVLVASTNHEQMLDSAIWRRFDDVLQFKPPTESERMELFKRLLSGVIFKGSLQELSRGTVGLSHAEITHASIAAMKTMVLSRFDTMSSKDVLLEVHRRKRAMPSREDKRRLVHD